MDFILQNGGDIFSEDGMTCTLNSDECVEAIQFLLDLMYTEKVSPTQAEQVEIQAENLFQNEMAAMVPFGLWNMKPYVDAMGEGMFDLAPMPQKAQKGTIVHNLGYALSSKANQEAGMKLMAYLASKDHGDRIAKVFAPAQSESQQLWFDTYPDYKLNVFTDGLSYAKGLMIPKKNAGQVYSLYEVELDRLFLNYEPGMDLKAELTKITDVLNAEIAK
jgi:multiple sugar transport system substrate-binding protein